MRRALIVVLTAAALAAGCTSGSRTTGPASLGDGPPSSSPAPSSSGPLSSLPLPDKTLTPGAVATTDISRLCPHVDPALEAARPSSADKAKVYQLYGLTYPQPFGKYELDHLIPIELGGNPNSAANEWPEPNDTPDPALVARFHLPPSYVHNSKDIVEDVLHGLVCGGLVPLTLAQAEIAADWRTAFQWYVVDGERIPMSTPTAPVATADA